jgi:hypothetical protein
VNAKWPQNKTAILTAPTGGLEEEAAFSVYFQSLLC